MIPFAKNKISRPWRSLLFFPALFVLVGPLVGWFGFLVVALALGYVDGTAFLSAHELVLAAGLLPFSYAIGSIPAFAAGFAFGVLRLILPSKIIGVLLYRAALGGALGVLATQLYCQLEGLNTDMALWAGLPAGVVCGLLARYTVSSSSVPVDA
jgi:hypothetical protein